MNWSVLKFQVRKLVSTEIAPAKWQRVFHIKCQKEFTFANGYLNFAISIFVIVEEMA